MEMSLGYILGQPNDFKVCQRCGEVNWYEKEVCFSCNSREFEKNERRIRKVTKSEMRALEQQGIAPQEIEIEV